MIGPHTLSVHTEAITRARGFARRRLDVVDQVDAGALDVPAEELTFEDFDAARARMIGNVAAFAGRPAHDRTRRHYAAVIDCLTRLMGETDTPAPTIQGALF